VARLGTLPFFYIHDAGLNHLL